MQPSSRVSSRLTFAKRVPRLDSRQSLQLPYALHQIVVVGGPDPNVLVLVVEILALQLPSTIVVGDRALQLVIVASPGDQRTAGVSAAKTPAICLREVREFASLVRFLGENELGDVDRSGAGLLHLNEPGELFGFAGALLAGALFAGVLFEGRSA